MDPITIGLILAAIGTIVGAGTGVAGSMISAQGQKEANIQQMAYNSAEAQKNRDWQEMMSNTAHQREVKDLKEAGINPIVSANGGAFTSPVGASSSSSVKNQAPDLSDLAKILSSTKDLALIAALTKKWR